jgi:5'(3')-deoxyribonucleotidase
MKKSIMIDMDDVVCDGGFLYLINQFTHKNYTVEDFTKYYMQDVIPLDSKSEWQKFFASNNMYEHANFIGNAHDVIQKLNEKYEVFIVTSYITKDNISTSGKLLKDKFDWLQENLPFISPYNYVFTGNKDIIDCDIKIDDKLSNLTGNIHTKTKLLFTAYHNKNLADEELNNNNVQRVDNWNEIEKILL